MKQKNINISNFKIGNNLPFTLIAGPCQLESRTHAFKMVEKNSKKLQKNLKLTLFTKHLLTKLTELVLKEKEA